MRHTNGGFLTSQRAPSLGAGCVPGIRERTCTSQRQTLAVTLAVLSRADGELALYRLRAQQWPSTGPLRLRGR